MAKEQEKKVGLTIQILIALVAGVALGGWAPEWALRLSFLGEIFMAGLLMLIMPLILVTMISGVGSLGDPEELGRMGARTILYYFCTTLFAIIVGLIVVNVMRPGETVLPKVLKANVTRALTLQKAASVNKAPSSRPTSGLSSLPASGTSGKAMAAHLLKFEQMFAKHILRAMSSPSDVQKKRARKLAGLARRSIAQQLKVDLPKDVRLQRVLGKLRTELIYAEVGVRRGLKASKAMRAESAGSGKVLTVGSFLRKQIKKVLQNPFQALAQGNVLAVIVFALMLGLILVRMGERGRPALELADTLNDAMMRFVVIVMKITPIGVFSLMATQIARSGLDILFLLAKYMLCVLVALLLHALVVLPLVLWLAGRVSPFRFFRQVRDALSVAFSTASSSATLPVSLEVVEEEAGVPGRVAGFVLPLGATVNMDGTALYEAIAAMFIAQLYGVDLGIGPQILIFLTAALAAIGAAGIPSAGTVTLVMVLSAVGLPISGVGLILAVDRLLDMCRTTVNVWGDLIGAAVLARFEPEEPASTPEESASS